MINTNRPLSQLCNYYPADHWKRSQSLTASLTFSPVSRLQPGTFWYRVLHPGTLPSGPRIPRIILQHFKDRRHVLWSGLCKQQTRNLSRIAPPGSSHLGWSQRTTHRECHRKWVGIMIHVFKLDLLSTTASWPGMLPRENFL